VLLFSDFWAGYLQKLKASGEKKKIECLAEAQPSFNLGVFYHTRNRLRTSDAGKGALFGRHFNLGLVLLVSQWLTSHFWIIQIWGLVWCFVFFFKSKQRAAFGQFTMH